MMNLFKTGSLRYISSAVLVFLAGCMADGDINEWRHYPQNNLQRDYHLYVPNGLLADDESVPLVINLHGATPSPDFTPTFGSYFQQIISGMPVHAANNHYIVAHPQSRQHGNTQYWVTSDNIDTDYINGLAQHLVDTLPIDPDKVYLTGFSSGGILSWKLACEYGERYAGIAPVAADRRAVPECPTASPVPVISFHGTDDPTVEFSGGLRAIEKWAEENQCAHRQDVFQKDDSTCENWTQCNGDSNMMFCRSERTGHTWPSGPGSIFISAAGYGRTTYSIDATDLIWRFFTSQALDGFETAM